MKLLPRRTVKRPTKKTGYLFKKRHRVKQKCIQKGSVSYAPRPVANQKQRIENGVTSYVTTQVRPKNQEDRLRLQQAIGRKQ